MIAHVRGHLIQKSPGAVIIEANGIGYRIHISLSTFYDLPDLEETIKIYTYTHVREDALQLYGFSSLLEKGIFQMLISVSGIGPKLGLNILSGIAPADLMRSLETGDVTRLMGIPGVGRKTAERLIFDLREKAHKIQADAALRPMDFRPRGDFFEDVVSALVNLGYKKSQAEKAVETVIQETPGVNLEKALKESLKILAAS